VNRIQYLLPVVALVIILAVALTRSSQHRTNAAKPSSAVEHLSNKSAASLTTTTTRVAAAAKPVDVFFLSEGTQNTGAASRPATMRQPTITGTRTITDPRPLTSKSEGDFIAPKWSPDGLQLLFSKPGYNGLYTRAVSGGPINQITDREGVGFKSKWNETGDIETHANTGETQTFKSDGTPMDAAAYESDTSLVGAFTKDDTVYLRSAPGEQPVPITDGDDRYYGGVLSPDGKYIAYNGLNTGLYVKPVDGSGPAVSLGEGYSPSWLPDGSGLVYNISRDDGHNIIGGELYLSSPDGSQVSQLTKTDGQAELNPNVSPDGTHIAYEVDGVVYIGTLH
jgi:Tol biopolymer transport system component